jgi:alkaline phosphatase
MDSSERLLLREGVIDKIPRSLCGNDGGKNVILVVGDGMGWEMVRAGAIAKRVVTELERMGCDIATGCPDNIAAQERFAGRVLADYYTEGKQNMSKMVWFATCLCFINNSRYIWIVAGKGSGLSFQDLEGFGLMTTTATVTQAPNAGNHYATSESLLEGDVSGHDDGMAPLALDECGNPIDFSPLDFELDGGNMVLWNDALGGEFPWDSRYFTENPDTSDGFDPTFIMQHATDSASTAGTMATGHKAAVNMMSMNLYEEKVSTLVEDGTSTQQCNQGKLPSNPNSHVLASNL